MWADVLVSACTGEPAEDGAFGPHLHRLLTKGPVTAEMRLLWEPYSAFIRASDFGLAAKAEWSQSAAQQPDFGQQGVPGRTLPNPLFRRGRKAQVVAHLLQAARSGLSASAVPDAVQKLAMRHFPSGQY